MREKIMIVFQRNDTGEVMDLEIPTNISITELIFGLNIGLNLGIDMNNPAKCFLRSENPIALLKGEGLVEDYKLHDGSKIIFD